MSTDKKDTGRQRDEDLQVLDRVKRPKRRKVILHNDDYTPMEFVVHVLEEVFFHSSASATRIMLTVHNAGEGVAGTYPGEIAEAKAARAIRVAREAGFPLMVTTQSE